MSIVDTGAVNSIGTAEICIPARRRLDIKAQRDEHVQILVDQIFLRMRQLDDCGTSNGCEAENRPDMNLSYSSALMCRVLVDDEQVVALLHQDICVREATDNPFAIRHD